MLWRLGVRSRGEESDQQLVEAMAEALSKTGIGIVRFFFDWFGGHRHGPGPADAGYDRPEFNDFLARLSSYSPRLASTPVYFRDAAPCSMLIDAVEAIWSAIAGDADWKTFPATLAAVRLMAEAPPRVSGLHLT